MSVDYRYFPALAIPGGTAGQVLTKSSNDADNGAQWTDSQAGTGTQGPPGPAGPVGPAGAAGTPGATGATGATGAGLKSFRGSATTDGSGNATFNLTAAAFASAPIVTTGYIDPGTGAGLSMKVTAVSATSCTVQLIRSLNTVGVASATVYIIAMPSGSQV